MKNILVTGGCGFIASNFINYFLNKFTEYKIVNIDALYYCGNESNIIDKHRNSSNYKFIKGNICQNDLINYILDTEEIDTVIHFAAQSHVDNSFSNPIQYTKDNILGTHILLEAVRKYGKIEKFIHVSTDEVYGETSDNKDDIKSEKSILNPTNPYAATKASAEMIVNSYVYSYNLPIIITRGNNVYGPRQYPEKLIPKFINLLLENKKCTLHGEGDTVRSFLYTDDVSKAFELILFKGVLGEIYNIGTDITYSVKDITKLLVSKIKNIPLDKVDISNYTENIEDRKYNDFRYDISFNKLEKLGWKQEVFIDEGLVKTIEYFIK